MKPPRAKNFDLVVAAWQWRWAQDRWFSKGGTILPYDKLEHFIIGIALWLTLRPWIRLD